MRKLIAYTSVSCLIILISGFSLIPVNNEATPVTNTVPAVIIPPKTIAEEACMLYQAMNLGEKGLSTDAFEYAYKGYMHLLKKNKLSEPGYLTICDFSQSVKQKRLYVIDLVNDTVLLNTYVAHGRNSGGEYATRFSNNSKSLQSSLGFYITKNTYRGEHGLSLRVDGVEPGFNDRAYRRAIVVHGANYIGEGVEGRSFGCPAVPKKESGTLINTIKNGTCLFIYHPQKKYLQRSKILNG